MKLLVVGNGGREHAIAWKLAQSPLTESVFVAPGNAGTALENKVSNIPIGATDIDALLQFAKTENIDFTIVGPEAPLSMGIVDQFQQHQLPCIGPTQRAAALESSKAFSKAFMQRHRIPTAAYATFHDLSAAKAYARQQTFPLVIKADGLAAGKGVVIAENLSVAFETLDDMLSGKSFAAAGKNVVIETFLQGEEASLIVLADGQHFVPFASAQDHKRRDDNDQGPNTGGMGAYSPAPILNEERLQWAYQHVITPTLKGMAQEGNPFTGFLYAGLMIAENGDINVLEFNARLGDPETQVILPRLQSDLVRLCLCALKKELNTFSIRWDPRPALGVVMAAAGYPFEYEKNKIITGLTASIDPETKVFHAATVEQHSEQQSNTVTQGGRVLCVTAMDDTLLSAKKKAYDAVQKIHWDGVFYRRDIGNKAIRDL